MGPTAPNDQAGRRQLTDLGPVLEAPQTELPFEQEYPFHMNPDELVVTCGDRVVDRLPCERTALDCGGRWKTWHVGAFLCRTSAGELYVSIGGDPTVTLASSDDGRTWRSWDMNIPEDRRMSCLTVLSDDSLVAGTAARQEPDAGDASARQPIRFYRSTDGGRGWTAIGEIAPGPFYAAYVDGKLLRLRDGTLLAPVYFYVPGAEGPEVDAWVTRLFATHIMRSTDDGRTWHNGPDPALWGALIEAKTTLVGVAKEARAPGPGGMFIASFEIGLEESADGTVLAAIRHQPPRQPWETPVLVADWRGELPELRGHGNVFKNVLLGDSPDAGVTWRNLRPVRDSEGNTLLSKMDTSAELVQMPDGRLVMIVIRRVPYQRCQLIAKVSEDGSQTWSAETYRVMAGFGYPSSLALPDGTIVTVSGKTIPGYAGYRMGEMPHGAEVIRWRLAER